MTTIRTLEDLAQAKAEALEQQAADARQHRFHIQVSMASCGIAAGARDTWEAINRLLSSGRIPGVDPAQIRITQIGCIGLCALEPIVQVQATRHSMITYGKVTPEIARRILQEHIGKGMMVQEYVVENI